MKGRRLLALSLGLAGIVLLWKAGAWRAGETWLSAHGIAWVTGRPTVNVAASHVVVVYDRHAHASGFVLTSECSVAYFVAALTLLSAPLLLVPRLPIRRVLAALGIASGIVLVVNIVRLTAIGAAVDVFGVRDGFAFSHTYLGSLLTFLGTCAAGVSFTVVLLAARSAAPAAGRHRIGV